MFDVRTIPNALRRWILSNLDDQKVTNQTYYKTKIGPEYLLSILIFISWKEHDASGNDTIIAELNKIKILLVNNFWFGVFVLLIS